jgi:hypothetical protein
VEDSESKAFIKNKPSTAQVINFSEKVWDEEEWPENDNGHSGVLDINDVLEYSKIFGDRGNGAIDIFYTEVWGDFMREDNA